MASATPLQDNHQVLNEDFCSGYMDPFGKWNNGFTCPPLEDGSPGLCCGVETLRYCCSGKVWPMHTAESSTQFPLVMGIVFGVSVAMVVSVVLCCFKCSCCLLYKKRQPTNTGPLYRLHCSSAASGVANMYSFSATTTPAETPTTTSRASSRSYGGGVSNRWSVGTGDSGPSLVNLDHHLALLENVAPTNVHNSFRASNPGTADDQGGGDGIQLGLSANLGGPERELPPPYDTNHSTLLTVRSSSLYNAATSAATTLNNSNSNSTSCYNSNLNNNHRSPSPTPPPPSVVSSSASSHFPSSYGLQHGHSRLSSCVNSTSSSSSPRPTHQRNSQHNAYTPANNENYWNGLASFLPTPSETGISSISSGSFSLGSQPTPLVVHNSQNQHSNANHHQVYNTSNVDHHHQQCNSFAPVLSPTTRPCSTAHIIHTHQNTVTEDQLYTATKF